VITYADLLRWPWVLLLVLFVGAVVYLWWVAILIDRKITHAAKDLWPPVDVGRKGESVIRKGQSVKR
jgi:hypothetical protein